MEPWFFPWRFFYHKLCYKIAFQLIECCCHIPVPHCLASYRNGCKCCPYTWWLPETPGSYWSHISRLTLHKKWSFPLRISSVNVTKSAFFPFFHFFRIFSFEDVHMSLLTSFFTLVLVSSLLMFLIGWMFFIALLLNVPKCYEDADPSSYLLTLLYLLSVFFCKTISTPPLLLGLPRLLSLLLCGSNS